MVLWARARLWPNNRRISRSGGGKPTVEEPVPVFKQAELGSKRNSSVGSTMERGCWTRSGSASSASAMRTPTTTICNVLHTSDWSIACSLTSTIGGMQMMKPYVGGYYIRICAGYP